MLEQDLYVILKKEIHGEKGSFILLNTMIKALENADFDMPTYLQSPSGRKALCRTINKLTRENLITPVGRKPQTTEGLFLKYRINKERTQNDDIIRREIIKSIAPPGKLDYYLKNTGDYLKDMDIIKIISQFLIKEGTDYITVNERSYELFGDEKFFKGDEKTRSRGEVVLRRLGLDYSDLRCYETPEPFFSFIKKSFYTQDSRKIIIIENKDTFWSFKKYIMDEASVFEPDMLIYGEGKKIIKSFKFIKEYDVNTDKDLVYYFGDLDSEGINIYYELKEKYPQYNIELLHCCYKDLLKAGLLKGLKKTPKKQLQNNHFIDAFAYEFDKNTCKKLKDVLYNGFYIPQEALSATMIKERCTKRKND